MGCGQPRLNPRCAHVNFNERSVSFDLIAHTEGYDDYQTGRERGYILTMTLVTFTLSVEKPVWKPKLDNVWEWH